MEQTTAIVEAEELSKREKYRERRGEEYEIVSKVAFLIGVSDSHWKSQYTGLEQDIYEQLSEDKNACIIRNLCGLRTEIEQNFKRFSMLILMELKNLHTIPQTQGMVNQLHKDGIEIIKANPKFEEYLLKINSLLQQHIDACKTLFPIWVNWEFVRQLFIIPGGNSTKKSKEIFEYYMENLERYPYRMDAARLYGKSIERHRDEKRAAKIVNQIYVIARFSDDSKPSSMMLGEIGTSLSYASSSYSDKDIFSTLQQYCIKCGRLHLLDSVTVGKYRLIGKIRNQSAHPWKKAMFGILATALLLATFLFGKGQCGG